MQTNQILSAPLIDIIFDGRNKDYGAYELRNKYNKRIKKALLVTGVISALAFGSVVLASSVNNKSSNYRIGPEMTIQAVPDQKPPEKLPEPDKPKPQEPKTQTVKFTEPKMVETVETPPPTQEQIDVSIVDTEKREGVEDDGAPEPDKVVVDDGKGIIEDKIIKDLGPVVNVDIDAKFDGNWKRFLETHLNAEVPVNNSAPAGRYSVVIRFVVDVDGSMSEITALTNHGYGLEQEAIRVIKKSKKWEPAFLNGFHVKAYKKQVIVFDVIEE